MPDARQVHSDKSYTPSGRNLRAVPRNKAETVVSSKEEQVASRFVLSDEKSKKIDQAVEYLHSLIEADIMAERASAVPESKKAVVGANQQEELQASSSAPFVITEAVSQKIDEGVAYLLKLMQADVAEKKASSPVASGE